MHIVFNICIRAGEPVDLQKLLELFLDSPKSQLASTKITVGSPNNIWGAPYWFTRFRMFPETVYQTLIIGDGLKLNETVTMMKLGKFESSQCWARASFEVPHTCAKWSHWIRSPGRAEEVAVLVESLPLWTAIDTLHLVVCLNHSCLLKPWKWFGVMLRSFRQHKHFCLPDRITNVLFWVQSRWGVCVAEEEENISLW